MADTRGTWSLSETWAEAAALPYEWVPIPNVWTKAELDDAAYMVGGTDAPGPYNSRYDKIAYSTDTKSTLTAVISGNIGSRGGASSPIAGYTMGGLFPASPDSKSSKIDKLTYATSTNSQLTGTLDDSQTWGGAGGGSSTAGYLCGGYNPDISDIRKVTYATDTIQTLPANISNPAGANYNMGSSGNADDFLYLIGGASGAGNEAKKFTYSSESCSNIPNMPTPGSLNRSQRAGCSSSSLAAYISGGSNPTNSRIDKITFSNDTTSYVTNSTTIRMEVAGTGSPSAGYFSGGSDFSITEKITMSTESNARVPALDLTIGGKRQTGISAKQDNRAAPNPLRWVDNAAETNNNAYSGGGEGTTSGNSKNTITKFDFATDTAEDISPSATLSQGRSQMGAVSSPSAGYWMGGNNGYGNFSRTDKITYATDSVAYTPGANLSGARYGSYSTGNTTAGYSGGANTSGDGVGSVMDKLTYATDTTALLPGSNLTETRIRSGVAGSLTVGYWMGSAFERSTTDKMTYSTEAVAVVPSAQLPTKRGAMGATASATDVYGAGGRQSPGDAKTSQILKLNLSSETISVDASLASIRYGVSGAGNATKGYFIGGSVGPVFPSGARTSVNKLTYSTSTVDTTLTQPNTAWESGSMARRGNSLPFQEPPAETPTASKAPGPSFNGTIWMGGYTPSNSVVSSGGKMSFSDDTITMLPSTHLTGNRYNLAATSSSLAGYYGNAQTTQVVKVDYATSSPSTLPGGISGGPGGPGVDPRRRGASFGPKTEGYMMQGDTGSSGNLSNFDRITYSTEVIERLPGSNCPSGTYASSGTSNQTTGFLNRGEAGSQLSKIPFSTLTWSSAPGADFSMWDGATFSNATHGFWVGSSGNNTGSIVQKLIYATDAASRLPGSNFPLVTRYGWGSGNSTHGYKSGGGSSAPATTTNVYKIAYSNETWSITPNTTNPATRQNAAAGARDNANGSQADNTIPIVI